MKEALEYLAQRVKKANEEADHFSKTNTLASLTMAADRMRYAVILNDIQMVLTLIKHENENK